MSEANDPRSAPLDPDDTGANRPTLAVSMGDPGGVGPEVIVKALSDRERRGRARYLIYGSSSAMLAAAHACGVEPFWWRISAGSDLFDAARVHGVVLIDDDDPGTPGPFRRAPDRRSGELSFRWVERAIASAQKPAGDPLHADAIVTGPINKRAWDLAGRGRYPGHTELLASRFKCRRFAMMFESPKLRVVLATVHIPLMAIRDRLTIGAVHDAIDLGIEGCHRLGVLSPRVAVCGLNPHAGEDGTIGDEEQRVIEPAIQLVRERGVDVRGPFPGDTVFNRAVNGEFDLVVAMYHDQGLIPLKLLGFEDAVNITIGLPVVRTSPDHGTAFDIAGRGIADERSTAAAMDLAVRMTLAPHAPPPRRG